MLKEEDNLKVDQKNLQHRKTNKSKQPLLLSKLRPVVNSELNVTIGQLRKERTTQLVTE